MIAGVKSVMGTLGIGIHLDSSGTSRHTIAGNVIKQCEGSAIVGEGGNNDVVVSGNVIDGTNLVVPDASIVFHSAERIHRKPASQQPNGQPDRDEGQLQGLADHRQLIRPEQQRQSGALSVDTTVVNNSGYNPLGTIANPWQPSGALTNDGGGGADPVSGRLYTVRQSPKTIIIAGGVVSQIAIDGTSTGLTAGVFKLGIGETITVTYSATPTSKIVAE